MPSKAPLHIVPSGGGNATWKTLRILVCDDERDTANMLACVLREEGHELHVALRGDDALELCRLFRPDVVISDVNIPGESGYAIARELRQRLGPLAPLLIAISGKWTKQNDQLVGKAVGFDHYLIKPADPKEVIRLIERLRSGQWEPGKSSAQYPQYQ
jgi:DNA-binding response OmpR family regulator